MAFFENLLNAFSGTPDIESVNNAPEINALNDFQIRQSSGNSTVLYTGSFNGEKNLGELGPIKKYYLDYAGLRARSWQAYLESEVAQIVIGRYITWVIGNGLKLQAEPSQVFLNSEGITLDGNAFSEAVEAAFSVWSDSKYSDYSHMIPKTILSADAYKQAIVGGDVLMVMRLEDGIPNIQIIEGEHVETPATMIGSELYPHKLENGNTVIDGVELSARGEYVAFYVRTGFNSHERIAAIDPISGLTIARLIVGLKYRKDSVRGLPLLTAVMETAKKMERYKEATVGSAEERQKVTYYATHELNATGENPMLAQMARARGGDTPRTDQGESLSDKVIASTNKVFVNMPAGADLKSIDSKNELYFKDFYTVNIDIVCATIQIPPNVAMSKYDANFSASRAALKDWEHTLIVKRFAWSSQWDKPIYAYWLHVRILQNKIQATGYLIFLRDKNWLALDAYRTARFVGANVPHIDPVKEVNAERLKLGDTGASLPLTTLEAATEALNGGDSDANMMQYSTELAESKKLKIEVPLPVAPVGTAPKAADEA